MTGIEANLTVYDNSGMYQTVTRNNSPVTFGADGTVDVPNLKRGASTFTIGWNKCWLTGETNYYSISTSNFTASLRGGLTPYLFSLMRGGIVTATVHDKEGKPLKDAEFSIYSVSNFNAMALDVKSDYSQMKRSRRARPMRPAR